MYFLHLELTFNPHYVITDKGLFFLCSEQFLWTYHKIKQNNYKRNSASPNKLCHPKISDIEFTRTWRHAGETPNLECRLRRVQPLTSMPRSHSLTLGHCASTSDNACRLKMDHSLIMLVLRTYCACLFSLLNMVVCLCCWGSYNWSHSHGYKWYQTWNVPQLTNRIVM